MICTSKLQAGEQTERNEERNDRCFGTVSV
jgi:hypothetical protein